MTTPEPPIVLTLSRTDADLIDRLWHEGIDADVEGLIDRLHAALSTPASERTEGRCDQKQDNVSVEPPAAPDAVMDLADQLEALPGWSVPQRFNHAFRAVFSYDNGQVELVTGADIFVNEHGFSDVQDAMLMPDVWKGLDLIRAYQQAMAQARGAGRREGDG